MLLSQFAQQLRGARVGVGGSSKLITPILTGIRLLTLYNISQRMRGAIVIQCIIITLLLYACCAYIPHHLKIILVIVKKKNSQKNGAKRR
jgi:hypothetical protein